MKNLLLITFLVLSILSAKSQFVFKENSLIEQTSILPYSWLADAGSSNFTLQDVIKNNNILNFRRVSGTVVDLGFTSKNYWLKFDVKNETNLFLTYYLELADPISNSVNLYLVNGTKKVETEINGNYLNVDKSIFSRKTIFKIEIAPGETKNAYLEIKNGVKRNRLSLSLISQQKLLKEIYLDQLFLGIFYGVLIIIVITYLFFYFALRELTFLYFSFYVLFVALCQFSLDGFYRQYIGHNSFWINVNIINLSSILSWYFFIKYSKIILNIKENNYRRASILFNSIYFLLAIVLAGLIFIPEISNYTLLIVRIHTVIGIILTLIAVSTIVIRKEPMDLYYLLGVTSLSICMLFAIYLSFDLSVEGFSPDKIIKPGIALQIIALSLSMANRIGVLKTKKEELQAIALQKSEEMNDIKSYFLSNMSHELRTPLNAILGLAAIMEKDNDDEKIKANCEVIRYASYGLLSSVNDILDFSKINNGELQLEKSEFNPLEILNKLCVSVKRQIEDKNLFFNFYTSLSSDLIILGDPGRLEQIIYNVLGNSIKFTQNGTVSFETKSTFVDNFLNLEIIITDTGVGIPEEKLQSIFGLFSQTNQDTKRKFGGFGIGLSIVKSLVDLHDGKINIESKLHEGTTCIILLTYPIIIKKKAISPKISKNDYDLFGIRVLIVEDNQMNQMIIQMMLEGWKNTEIGLANDGAECLEMMKKEHFDVILMDLQMPVMDGFEAINSIRTGQAGKDKSNTPIIVITADITKNTKDRIFSLGANDYMNKPINNEHMYEKIRSVLVL